MGVFEEKLRGVDKVFTYGDFVPFSYQYLLGREMFRREELRRAFIILPRRAGKTEVMVIYLIKKAIEKAIKGTNLSILRYALVYPELSNGKVACWDALESRTMGLPMRKVNKQVGSVEFYLPSFSLVDGKKGVEKMVKVRISILGLKNMDSRRGGGYDGLVLDEVGFLPMGYERVIQPMVGDKVRQPTFLMKIGTPNEENDFWRDFDKYRAKEKEGDMSYFTFRSSYGKLKHIDEETFNDLTVDMSPEEVDIEFHCKRGVVSGAKYYTEECDKLEKDGMITDLSVVRDQKKVLSCDIGASARDLFAIWVSQWNPYIGKHELIDYCEISGADDMKVFDWCQSAGHVVGQIILPWDGAVGMKPPCDLLRDRFVGADILVLPRGGKEVRINRIRASRVLFNHIRMDRIKCALGLSHLKGYSKKWDKVKKIYLLNPKHDIHSHGADAFGHLAVADKLKMVRYSQSFDIYDMFGNNKKVQQAKTYEPIVSGYKPISLEEESFNYDGRQELFEKC